MRTCDNHCEFCFIYQLPPGMRQSLYLKDDDYRLSFLYGNFTTLTRFTEADLERVVTERLSPLNVSIHATDPEVRAELLRNRRGATSLRWLRALLDHGIEVHGQIVVCPGVNDGAVLDDTLAGVLDQYPELASLCVVPLGVSRYNTEPAMRPHTRRRGRRRRRPRRTTGRTSSSPCSAAAWCSPPTSTTCWPSGPFPAPEAYEGFPMHEDGIGMARTFELEFTGAVDQRRPACSRRLLRLGRRRARRGLPGAPHRRRCGPAGGAASASCGRRSAGAPRRSASSPARTAPGCSTPLVAGLGRDDVRVLPVRNEFFGGNTGVTGLMVGADLARVLAAEPDGHRYLLPDVCLSRGSLPRRHRRPPTCPGRSRSSPPTASPCAAALEATHDTQPTTRAARRRRRRPAQRRQVHAA